MAYDIGKISATALMRLAFDAGLELTRLDEHLARSSPGQGFIERSHFTEACASLWMDVELVQLDDLVLHDATKDIRTPTHELKIARGPAHASAHCWPVAWLGPILALSPTAGALTGATVGAAYSQTVTGTLPAGLSLNTSTGAITSTPTTAGNASFTVTATDANSVTGSANYTLTVNATTPGAPVIGNATAGEAQATVSFTAPSGNGDCPITSYTVTASPGGATGTGSASPITVAGLANGTAYTFTVTAPIVSGRVLPRRHRTPSRHRPLCKCPFPMRSMPPSMRTHRTTRSR